jgi:hypothetical protein
MDLSPWNYWTKDGQPTTYTNEIVTTLESVMKRNPKHPGANHYYIHAIEASQTPEKALLSAQRLRLWCQEQDTWCICLPIFTGG